MPIHPRIADRAPIAFVSASHEARRSSGTTRSVVQQKAADDAPHAPKQCTQATVTPQPRAESMPCEVGPLALMFIAQTCLSREEIAAYFDRGSDDGGRAEERAHVRK